MKGLVTSKGQVTLPKELREKFDIQPGTQVDFAAAEDGIRLRKVVDRSKRLGVLGCLKKELAGRSVTELRDELRGPVELPRYIGAAGDFQGRIARRASARSAAIGG